MKRILIALPVLLSGCIHSNYPYSTDPDTLLDQAWSAANSRKPALSEDLAAQSLRISEQRGYTEGMAEAHYFLGILYEDDLYMKEAWSDPGQSAGTWDVTYTESIQNFAEAQRLFEQVGDENGVALSLFGAGLAYGKRDEQEKACSFYIEASTRYQDADASGQPIIEHRMLPGYPNSGALIAAYIAKALCGTQELEPEVAAQVATLAAVQAAAEVARQAAVKTAPTDYQILKGLVRVSYQQQESDPEILDLLAGKAWRDRSTEDKQLVDTLSWICRVLGQSQNPRYTTVLKALASEAATKKLKKYARVSLALLPDEDVAQFDFQSGGTGDWRCGHSDDAYQILCQ